MWLNVIPHRIWIVAALAVGLAHGQNDLRALSYNKSSVNLPSSIVAMEAAYDLDGDGLNDIVAVYQRRIMIFFQTDKGTFSSAPDIEIGGEQPIPDKYAGVSIGKVAPERGYQLLLIGETGVDYISFSSIKSGVNEPVEPRNLLTESLRISNRPELVYLNCAVDMDGDGTPELVLPVGNSLVVYSSFDGAPYAEKARVPLSWKTAQVTSLDREPFLLGSAFFNQPGGGGNVRMLPEGGLWHSVRYSSSRYVDNMLMTDFDGDRRIDLVGNGFLRYQQDDGGFEKRLDSNVFRRVVTSIVPHESRNVLVTIPNLVDFNDDKRWDTYSVNVTAAKLSPRTDISVYLGGENRQFSDKPTQVLRTRDFAYSDAIPIGDINGDGAQDIALFHLDFQPSSMQSQLKAYLKNGLDGELRFYTWDKSKKQFPDSATFRHPVTVSYEIYGARQFFRQQVSISQNMVGSDLPDLVLKTGGMEFSVFENQGDKGFSRSASAVVSTSPTKFSSLETVDLNQDGLGDVIITGYLDDQDDRIIYTFFTSQK